MKWALHFYFFDFVYTLVFVFLFVFVFVFAWFIDVLADCVGEEWVCEVDSASSNPLTHPPQTSNNAQTLSNLSISSSSLTLYVIDYFTENTIVHDTSPCSSRTSAQSLSQVGGLLLPYANIVPGVPKKFKSFVGRPDFWTKVAYTESKWPKKALSCPNDPR